VTTAAVRPAVPSWFLDLEPGSPEFDECLAALPDEDRAAVVEWLASLTPDATFEALGYVPTARQWELHDLAPWSEGGPWDVLYGGAAGGGKLARISTPVPTPTGWTTMGDLKAGDEVLTERGTVCRVLIAHRVVERPESYRLEFDDGEVIYAGAEHLWLTYTAAELQSLSRRTDEFRSARRAKRPSRALGRRTEAFTAAVTARNHRLPPLSKDPPSGAVRSTAEIAATLRTASGRANHAVPVAAAVELPEVDLPLDPYLLGVWLGDGTTRAGSVTTMDPEIRQAFIHAGWRVSDPKPKRNNRASTVTVYGLVGVLREMGVWGNKHVPPAYLRGSVKQRLALLQGLLDTDGTATREGSVEFCSTLHCLADAVRELACSLGHKVGPPREGRAVLNGLDHGPKWTLKWRSPDEPFRLQRKLERWRPPTRRTTRFRYVVACDPVEPEPMRCITVDNPTRLYLLGRGFVPTHNTRGLLMDGLGWAARTPGIELWYVRATYPELRDSFLEELEKINHAKVLGADWTKSDYTLAMPNGAKLKFRHGGTQDAVDKLLSAQCQGLYIDERTTMDPKLLERISMRVRGSDPSVPIVGVRSGSNPGKVGHMDCKTKFYDPHPPGHRRIRVEFEGVRMDRYFIPAKIEDNPHLDSTYEARLGLLDPAIQRAYREGRWDYFEGMAFVDFNAGLHIVEPEDFPLRPGYPLGCGIDYGLANPFCALWGMRLPDGLIVVYRELYETELTPAEQARLVLSSEQPWERDRSAGRVQTWLDPSTWARQPDSPKPIAGAPPKRSIAETYRNAGVRVERAYNDRIGGKALVHTGLRVQADGMPRLVIHSTCRNLIRTLPNLPRDKTNPEDVDTNAEDHCVAEGTLIATPDGEVPVERLRPDDWVLTRRGPGLVVATGRTGEMRSDTIRVDLDNGRTLTCTTDHRVLTGRGWTTAAGLTPCDTLLSCPTPSSSARPSRSTPGCGGTGAAGTSNGGANGCTDGSGSTTTAAYPADTTSTTTTRTAPTTEPPTSWPGRLPRTLAGTALAHPRLLARHALATLAEPARVTLGLPSSSGPPPPSGAGTIWRSPRSAAGNATGPSTPPSRVAPGSAGGTAGPVRVVAVWPGPAVDVYDLTVLGAPEYFAEGVLVHNCYDALRYLLGGLTGRAPRPARTAGEALQSVRAGSALG
jgi:hypothetical protein